MHPCLGLLYRLPSPSREAGRPLLTLPMCSECSVASWECTQTCTGTKCRHLQDSSNIQQLHTIQDSMVNKYSQITILMWCWPASKLSILGNREKSHVGGSWKERWDHYIWFCVFLFLRLTSLLCTSWCKENIISLVSVINVWLLNTLTFWPQLFIRWIHAMWCNENQFYSLPFGQAVASMYWPTSHFN